MANTQLRQINEVNGWKINHPHSAANIVYAIFTFIFAAFPLTFLFIPLIADMNGNTPLFTGGLQGVAIFQFFIDFLKQAFTGVINMNELLATNAYISEVVNNVNPVLTQASIYLFVAIGGLLIMFMVFSVTLLILSIVHLAKGYLRTSAAVKRIAVTEFIFTIIFFIIMTFFYFAYKTQKQMDLFVWFSAIPLGASMFFMIFFSAFYSNHFKDTILENELEIQDDDATVEHISQVHEVTKVKYEGSQTLPPNIDSIGGHAFAENQNLTVANIPDNIDKLGPSAFANCLNLQVVSIPNSVKEIGFNCFFNCVSLERINYAGTKEEWRRIRRGSNWLSKAGTTEVLCLDGSIIVNPYH